MIWKDSQNYVGWLVQCTFNNLMLCEIQFEAVYSSYVYYSGVLDTFKLSPYQSTPILKSEIIKGFNIYRLKIDIEYID